MPSIVRTHFRTSKLADLARSRPGIPLDCVSTAASHLQPYQSLVSMVLCHGCFGWCTSRNVDLGWLRQQAAVRNDGGSLLKSISARRSVLIENERKPQMAAWLGVKYIDENRFDLRPFLSGSMQESFQSMPLIALSSKMCHPSYYRPSLPGACCLEVSGGSLWRSYCVAPCISVY